MIIAFLPIVLILYLIALILYDYSKSYINFEWYWGLLLLFGLWGGLITILGLKGWKLIYWCSIPVFLASMFVTIIDHGTPSSGVTSVLFITLCAPVSTIIGVALQIASRILNGSNSASEKKEPRKFWIGNNESLTIKHLFLSIPSKHSKLIYVQVLWVSSLMAIIINLISVAKIHDETTFIKDLLLSVIQALIIGTIGYKGWKSLYIGALIGLIINGLLTIVSLIFPATKISQLFLSIEYWLYQILGVDLMTYLFWNSGMSWPILLGILLGGVFLIIQIRRRN